MHGGPSFAGRRAPSCGAPPEQHESERRRRRGRHRDLLVLVALVAGLFVCTVIAGLWVLSG